MHSLYYFTGTGNSLYVAKRLKEKYGDIELISIVSAYNNKDFKPKHNSIGFLFPCHGFTTPYIVNEFIQKLDISDTEYIFTIITRGGTKINAIEHMNKIFIKQNRDIDASFIITAPSNDPKFEDFSAATDIQVSEFNTHTDENIDKIIEIISQKQSCCDDISGETLSDNSILEGFLEWFIAFMVHNMSATTKKYFYIDDKCTNCGLCEEICPANKIKQTKNGPVWQKSKLCYTCYACMNYCPVSSIQIHSKYYMKSFTKQNERYHHPDIKRGDISAQRHKNSITE